MNRMNRIRTWRVLKHTSDLKRRGTRAIEPQYAEVGTVETDREFVFAEQLGREWGEGLYLVVEEPEAGRMNGWGWGRTAFIKVESQARFDVALAPAEVRARDVIDMDQEDTAFGVGELDKFHSGASSKMKWTRAAQQNRLTSVSSR